MHHSLSSSKSQSIAWKICKVFISRCFLKAPCGCRNLCLVSPPIVTAFTFWGLPGVAQMVESVCSAGDPGSIPGSGRSHEEGNGNLLQYPCLEKSHGRRGLGRQSPLGCKESDMTEQLHFSLFESLIISTFRWSLCTFLQLYISPPNFHCLHRFPLPSYVRYV